MKAHSKIIAGLSLLALFLTGCNTSNGNSSDGVGGGSDNPSVVEDSYESSITTYTINYVLNGGTNNSSNPTSYTIDSNKIALLEPTRTGYDFAGWTYNGRTVTEVDPSWAENVTLVANWRAHAYSITYELNGGTNDSSNPSTYTIESSFTLNSPTKTGYTFVGWYDNNDNQISQITTGTTGALTLTAEWSANLNNLSVTSEDTSKGTVSITSGNGYSDETITVVATPIGDFVFKGWYHDDTKVSGKPMYTFTMPTNDYSLVARFFTKAEEEAEEERAIKYALRPILSNDGKTITYGLYPQTNVNDSELVSSLNALTTPESNDWYLYNDEYYAKVSATPFISYTEYDNGTTIVNGTTYWFKCEPIVWNVLSNNSGEYYILSSVLLDAHCYNRSSSSRTIDGEKVYPTNYEYSDIRTWLNNDFYNSAFALDNSNIQTTTVDNSAATTNSNSNSYACNNTKDKVFLPSYEDYTNSSYGFSTSTDSTNTRCCKTTDWTRARGARCSSDLYNGDYWTRSPHSSDFASAWRVGHSGYLNFYGGFVDDSYVSVRPGLSINIA